MPVAMPPDVVARSVARSVATVAGEAKVASPAEIEATARETVRREVGAANFDRIERFVAACRAWGRVSNLVSTADRDRLWERHVLDSLQLVPLAADAGESWIDLGSGGGFPGMIVAIARDNTAVTLVESNRKKAAFLVQAAAASGVPITVEARRTHAVPSTRADVVSARALAPLPELLDLAAKFFGPGTLGLFPKGRNAEAEIADARKRYAFAMAVTPSLTGSGAILSITDLRPVS